MCTSIACEKRVMWQSLMWQLCVLSSQEEIEDVQDAVCGWQRAGQSTFRHLHHLKRSSAIMKLRLLWFLSSQELFTEGADLIGTVGGGEFDQVRCKNKNKNKGTTQPSWKRTNKTHLVSTSAHPPLLSSGIRSLRGWMAPDRRREENSGGRASGGALRFCRHICCVTTECEQGWCGFVKSFTHDAPDISAVNWVAINWTTFSAYVWDMHKRESGSRNTKMTEIDKNKQNSATTVPTVIVAVE